MKEICYYVADDGKRFDDRWECIEYERRANLEKHKDDFIFLDYRKEPIPIEEVTTESVVYIVLKSENCKEVIGDWFEGDGCLNPFDGVYYDCVGTWVYGDVIDRGDEWLKLELEIEKLQTLHKEINQER